MQALQLSLCGTYGAAQTRGRCKVTRRLGRGPAVQGLGARWRVAASKVGQEACRHSRWLQAEALPLAARSTAHLPHCSEVPI